MVHHSGHTHIYATYSSSTQHNGLGNSLFVDPADLPGSTAAIQDSIMRGQWPGDLLSLLQQRLSAEPFSNNFVAVRSSGTDEDSSAHSFAGACKKYMCKTNVVELGGSLKNSLKENNFRQHFKKLSKTAIHKNLDP